MCLRWGCFFIHCLTASMSPLTRSGSSLTRDFAIAVNWSEDKIPLVSVILSAAIFLPWAAKLWRFKLWSIIQYLDRSCRLARSTCNEFNSRLDLFLYSLLRRRKKAWMVKLSYHDCKFYTQEAESLLETAANERAVDTAVQMTVLLICWSFVVIISNHHGKEITTWTEEVFFFYGHNLSRESYCLTTTKVLQAY